MSLLRITYQPPAVLKPRSSNPRTHSKAQLKQIADSIRVFGFTNPVLVDENNGLIAGHGRVEAAIALGLDRVPTVCLAGMTEAQIRAYVIADNRLAEKAGWDNRLLAIELQYLADLDLDFDVTITGFEMLEIDVLISGLDAVPAKPDPADAIPAMTGPAITRTGDIWWIGPHRLICGDSTRLETHTQLLDGNLAQMVFTDPPYNVKIDGHVSGLGAIKHREFAMAAGEMSKAEFTRFLETVFGHPPMGGWSCDAQPIPRWALSWPAGQRANDCSSAQYGSQPQARCFHNLIVSGEVATVAELADKVGISRSYFARVFRLSFLAPKITKAILEGRQPPELTANKLMLAGRLAPVWPAQRRQLGIE